MPSIYSDIVIPKGYVILLQSGNTVGFEMDNNSNLYGEVVAVNDLCESYAIGDIVLFLTTNVQILLYKGLSSIESSYLVREEDILFKENP